MDDARAAWERGYRTGARRWRPTAAPRWIRERLATLAAGARVLDLGCGNLPLDAGDGLAVVGVDYAGSALRLADRGRSALLQATAVRLPFGDAAFDAAVARHVLSHVAEEEVHACAVEVLRVLRPGAPFLVEVFGAGDLRDGKGEPEGLGAFRRRGVTTRYFEPSDVAGLVPGAPLVSLDDVRVPTRFGGARRVLRAAFGSPR